MTEMQNRALNLGLTALAMHLDQVQDQSWVPWLLDLEEKERGRRSLERRVKTAKLGNYKPLADFDWSWPNKVDRGTLTELFELSFVAQASNVILFGPNGVGKTMLAKNLLHQCLLGGHSACFTTASALLNELAAEDSASALERRFRRVCSPRVLCIDEVGYLSYGHRHADLLFEVVTRRYEAHKPVVITTNKAFRDWAEVFPNASCVVTLVDRLIHRSEVIAIDANSYRLKEAEERVHRRKTSARKR